MSTGAPAVNGANVVFAADDSASASSADETALPGAALGQPPDVPPMKYILITGGVISGVGKGIIASSLGVILKAHGLGVSAIKIDPYINIDAGTFSPYEHGEVYVLDDGGEVDLDLGNYERFLDVRLTRDNNLTTGKVYDWVIKRERKGDYLGKTVQVVPHVTDAIQDWVARVATIPVDGTGKRPDVCIIELGGTIGDIEGMPFVEAFRQLQFRARREHFMNVHVSLVLEPKATGEQKTKPTQNSVRELRCLGLFPDMVVCRSATPLQESVRRKVSHFCDVEVDKVICVHDVSNIYHVPLLLHAQNSLALLADRLHLRLPVAMSALSDKPTAHWTDRMRQWHQLATRCDRLHDTVSIALVGKYVTLQDAYTSVSKALQHAATAANRRLTIHYVDSEHLQNEHRDRKPAEYHDAWKILTTADGILVPGGFGDRGVEGKIEACKWARERNTPMLGICLGMQCAVIEFARNVAGLKEAHSTEFVKSSAVSRPSECVVVDMPEHSAATDAQGMGATMRLGLRRTVFLTKHCVTRKLYSRLSDTNRRSGCVDERHRHRYEVNPEHVPALADLGLRFVAMGVDSKRVPKVGGADEKEEPVKGMEEQLSALLIDEEKLEKACVSAANTERDGELRATLRHICVDGAMGRHTAVRMEIVELADHPFYVGVQFHPEYMSHPLRPSAPYLGLVLAASGQLHAFLDGSRIPSPLATPKHSDYSVAANLNVLGAK